MKGKYLNGMVTRCPSCKKIVVSFHVIKTLRAPQLFAFACKCGAQFVCEAMPVA